VLFPLCNLCPGHRDAHLQLSVSEIVAARSTLQGWYTELQGEGTTEAARRSRAAVREAEAQSYAQRIGELEAEVSRSPQPSGSREGGGVHVRESGRGQSPPPDTRPVAKQYRHVL
jgi:hypothetical protein